MVVALKVVVYPLFALLVFGFGHKVFRIHEPKINQLLVERLVHSGSGPTYEAEFIGVKRSLLRYWRLVDGSAKDRGLNVTPDLFVPLDLADS